MLASSDSDSSYSLTVAHSASEIFLKRYIPVIHWANLNLNCKKIVVFKLLEVSESLALSTEFRSSGSGLGPPDGARAGGH